MMTKVREFYDEKYLDAMPDEEIQEDLDSVSNDKASENQEKVVSIITRFLSLDKKCQKSFMSIANFKNCPTSFLCSFDWRLFLCPILGRHSRLRSGTRLDSVSDIALLVLGIITGSGSLIPSKQCFKKL